VAEKTRLSAAGSIVPTRSASSTATPLTVDSYVAQARAICDAGQQKVYDEITTVLHGVVYPNTFPSDAFVRFYQYTHGIGLDVIAQLHGLAVPAGDEARRDGDLAVMGSAVGFTAAAARAAAGNDEAPYGRLVSRKAPSRPPKQLLPPECLYLSLGPARGDDDSTTPAGVVTGRCRRQRSQPRLNASAAVRRPSSMPAAK
jgi:hypothetical protein